MRRILRYGGASRSSLRDQTMSQKRYRQSCERWCKMSSWVWVGSKTVAVCEGEWIEGEEENTITIHVKHRGCGFQMHICALSLGSFAESHKKHFDMLAGILETRVSIRGAPGLTCCGTSTVAKRHPAGRSSRLSDNMGTQAPLHRCTYNIPTSVRLQTYRLSIFYFPSVPSQTAQMHATRPTKRTNFTVYPLVRPQGGT
jgi:hypothetical protein